MLNISQTAIFTAPGGGASWLATVYRHDGLKAAGGVPRNVRSKDYFSRSTRGGISQEVKLEDVQETQILHIPMGRCTRAK